MLLLIVSVAVLVAVSILAVPRAVVPFRKVTYPVVPALTVAVRVTGVPYWAEAGEAPRVSPLAAAPGATGTIATPRNWTAATAVPLPLNTGLRVVQLPPVPVLSVRVTT